MGKVHTRPEMKLSDFHGLRTVSPQMRELFELIKRVGRTDASVLIRGETGTGKELVANALHRVSARANKPFKAINCATLTPELLASELFGHVRGAFTGAVKDRTGLFALADGGAVFLDEVAEISPENQARLLRVLQEKTFVPVGGSNPVTVDVRIISATNKALRSLVEAGQFREDLMYRIRVVPLFLPRLADRDGDVEALTWHFIDTFNEREARTIEAIDADAMDALLAYSWPGNIRELRNNIEYAFAIGEGPILTRDELTPELKGEPPPRDAAPTTSSQPQDERTRIMEALGRTGGRKGAAARQLGISRSTLWRKMRELGLSEENLPGASDSEAASS